jgi:hypothetical protein
MKSAYGEIYNEDSFQGVEVPFELKYVLDYLMTEEEDLIIDVFDNYEDYKNEEVEMSHYAKDGSDGTDVIVNVANFKNWFTMKFNHRIKAGRISEKTLDFINNLKEIEKKDDTLTDSEARSILQSIIEGITEELENNSGDEQTYKTLLLSSKLKLIQFRDNWFDKVV